VSNQPQNSIWLPDAAELRGRAKWRAGFWILFILFFLASAFAYWFIDGEFPWYLSALLMALPRLCFAVSDWKNADG
jgi:hypothetical protein